MVASMDEFHARDGMIRLGQLLKASGLVDTGGEAKLLLADEQVTRQRRGRDPPRAPAARRATWSRSARRRCGSHDARGLRGGLRAGHGQVRRRARRPAAPDAPRRAARDLPAGRRRSPARPADRPAAAAGRVRRAVRGVVRRRLRAGARRRGGRAGGDRRPLSRARRPVRRGARRRHGLRGDGVGAGLQRARGAQPRAAGPAGRDRPRAHAGGDPDRDLGRADDLAALGAGRGGRGGQPRAGLRARRGRGAGRRPARLRAARGRPADGADGRAGRRGLPRRGDRGRRRAAGPRGAAPDGGGDDAAEPDRSHHRRRRPDHAGRPRRGAAGGDVRARVDRAPLPLGRRPDRRAAAAGHDPRGARELRRDRPGDPDRARHLRDRLAGRARARARSPATRRARSPRRWRCSRPTSTATTCSTGSRSRARRWSRR